MIHLTISNINTVYKIETSSWSRTISHKRNSNGLVLFIAGSIAYNIEGTRIIAKENDLAIFPKNLDYSGKKLTDTNSYYVIDFDCLDDLNQLVDDYLITSFDYYLIQDKFEECLNHWNSNDYLGCLASIYSILAYILKDKNHSPKSLLMQQYLNENYQNNELTISSLANVFALSESQIRRIFAQELNMSPIEYLQNIRISHAKSLLNDGLSVSDAAYLSGYKSVYYFSRIFKEKNNITPTEYKKRNH